MNIEIKLHISFQITVNISVKKNPSSQWTVPLQKEVPLLSDLIVIDQTGKAKKTLISSHSFLRILVQSDLINKLMWIR